MYLKQIEDRTKNLKPEEKPLVYFEGYNDYQSASAASPTVPRKLDLAGGVNIAAGETAPYPKVSAEWVLAKNPQVIIKTVTFMKGASGYGASGEGMKKKREEIVSRPGWQQVRAVKDDQVYIVSGGEITSGPRMIAGLAYFAKWLHPGLFADLDPGAVHREMLKNFYGLEAEGTWVYPGGH